MIDLDDLCNDLVQNEIAVDVSVIHVYKGKSYWVTVSRAEEE